MREVKRVLPWARIVPALAVAASACGATTASHSDSAGRQSLTVLPGNYTVTADTQSQSPRGPSTGVTVNTHQVGRADVQCDTGIRCQATTDPTSGADEARPSSA